MSLLFYQGRLLCLHVESGITEFWLTDVQHGQFIAALRSHICKPYFEVGR